MVQTWDNVDAQEMKIANLKPFWSLNLQDEEEVRRWVCQTWDSLLNADADRLQTIMANIAAYRGIHYKTQDTRNRDIDSRTGVPITRTPRFVVNHLLDLIEQQVSRVTKYRPAVNCDPASDDHDDVITAKIGDKIIENVWYANDIDQIFQRFQRHVRIIGESFVEPEWDETKGDLDPDYVEEKKKNNGRVPLFDENGNQRIDDSGKRLWLDKIIRQGDIGYGITFSWDLQFQPNLQYEECQWAIRQEWMDIEDVRADWPDAAKDIKASGDKAYYFNPDTLEQVEHANKVLVLTLYHKRTKRLGEGWYVKVTRDAYLEGGKLPPEYNGQFPWVRVIDIENPGSSRGYAVLEQGRPLQGLYNNITSLMTKYLFLVAHPKWMMPRNACKMEALGNDATIVQYSGPLAPTLVNPPAINPAVFTARQETKSDLEQIMAVGGVSRGQPPAGVRAFIALQYLDEKDNERQNAAIARHNSAIKDLATKTLWMAAEKYDDNSGRLEDLLGKRMSAYLKFFKFENLRKITSSKAQTGSALPHQRSMRLQTILDLAERFPALMPNEKVVSLLELGQDKKFMNDATAAVQSAEAENEVWLQSGKIESPEEWEKHDIHYEIHMTMLNDQAFRWKTSEAAQKELRDHVGAHELAMIEISKRNPIYAQLLMTKFPQFPCIYTDEGMVDVLRSQQPQEQPPGSTVPPTRSQNAPAAPPPEVAMTGEPQPTPFMNQAPVAEPPAGLGQ